MAKINASKKKIDYLFFHTQDFTKIKISQFPRDIQINLKKFVARKLTFKLYTHPVINKKLAEIFGDGISYRDYVAYRKELEGFLQKIELDRFYDLGFQYYENENECNLCMESPANSYKNYVERKCLNCIRRKNIILQKDYFTPKSQSINKGVQQSKESIVSNKSEDEELFGQDLFDIIKNKKKGIS